MRHPHLPAELFMRRAAPNSNSHPTTTITTILIAEPPIFGIAPSRAASSSAWVTSRETARTA